MQINHLFGQTLEFSCTVDDEGKVLSQELVSSSSDCLISFKLDREAFLTPDDLRSIANKIEGRSETDCLELATAEETDEYLRKGRAAFKSMPLFYSNDNISLGVISVALAEYMAQADGKTLYSDHVTCKEEEDPNYGCGASDEEEEEDCPDCHEYVSDCLCEDDEW